MPKIAAAALACVGLMVGLAAVVAQPAWSGAQPNGAGLLKLVAHKHTHIDAHALLGDRIKHDGKHSLGKLRDQTVMAEVKGGKVTNMTAGAFKVTRVKSPTKVAQGGAALIRAAWGGTFQLTQYDTAYYAYCFDDGYGDYTCYWYPASDVDMSGPWYPYDPGY